MSNQNLLFVYGTLIQPQVQQKVIGRLVPGVPDGLEGFQKETIVLEDGVFPILVKAKGSIVKGWVLQITNTELASIDEYEGSAYQRVSVVLSSGKTAFVYTK